MIVSAKEVVESQETRSMGTFTLWAVIAFMLCMTLIGAPIGVWIWTKKAYPAYSGGLTRREVWHEQIRRAELIKQGVIR
jgi:hypothetical protein